MVDNKEIEPFDDYVMQEDLEAKTEGQQLEGGSNEVMSPRTKSILSPTEEERIRKNKRLEE